MSTGQWDHLNVLRKIAADIKHLRQRFTPLEKYPRAESAIFTLRQVRKWIKDEFAETFDGPIKRRRKNQPTKRRK